VKSAVSREQGVSQTVALMDSLVRSEIGSPGGKRIAIAVIGRTTAAERELIRGIVKAEPREVRGYRVPFGSAQVTESGLTGIGKKASVLLILGDSKKCPATVAELTDGMAQPVMLDSVTARTFSGSPVASVRRELFFGREADVAQREDRAKAVQDRARTIWILSISLLVTVICISNALLMSVTERFKEIGTMKCLGALSGFIRQLFLVESAIIGISGSFAGIVMGTTFPIIAYGYTYGFDAVLGSMNYGQLALYMLTCLLAGTLLSMMAAVYPATMAARMVPAMALRSNV
jgi:hypothetical protein